MLAATEQIGYTQEELAIRINVVRQTVSKWEKGLSVPDAEALQKISENEIAEQLARINEQLAIKNKRWNKRYLR